MVDESGSFLVEGDLTVRPDQHGHCARAPSASGRPILVYREVGGDDNAVSTVPVGGGYPVESVDEGVSGAVARINAGGPWVSK